MTDFKKLNLSAEILRSLEKKGYLNPTPIQLQAIPHLLEGRDFLGIAQTGTGKTAAFSLPLLDNLFKSKNPVKPNSTRALILTPTRELASQIADNIKAYGHDLHLKSAVIFGGVNENPQIRAMEKGVDILIATPGRLLDLMNRKHIKFNNLEIFVLDEADRMLDMGFINDIKKIITKLPEDRQTLFFSATMPKDIASLAQLILKDPIKIEITPQATTVEKIDQKINFVDPSHKRPLLKSIILQDDVERVLVFSKTKHNANKVVEYLLKESIKVAAIHGNKSQVAREKALDSFRQGNIKVLVATDIAARGIDVPGITHVVNYDIPNDPENYVHRIGRTARAGKEGVAISFCSPAERKLLAAIEKVIKIRIPVDRTHPYQDAAPTAVKSGRRNSETSEEISEEKERVKKPYNSSDYSRSNENRRRASFQNNERKGNSRGNSRSNFRDSGPGFKSEDTRRSSSEFSGRRERDFSKNDMDGNSSFRNASLGRSDFRERSSGFKSDFKPRADFSERRERSDYSRPRDGARDNARDGERNSYSKPFGSRDRFSKSADGERGNYSKSRNNGNREFDASASFGERPRFADKKESGYFNSGNSEGRKRFNSERSGSDRSNAGGSSFGRFKSERSGFGSSGENSRSSEGRRNFRSPGSSSSSRPSSFRSGPGFKGGKPGNRSPR